MEPGAEPTESTSLSPDEAFAVLGERTRLRILRTLGDADGPLAFSELFDRIDYESTANFSYHLEKLDGHFLHRTDDGYALRQAGQRVVEAVLSGAVTDAPVVERTRVDRPCQHCGAPSVEVEYAEEQVGIHCPECRGQYGGGDSTSGDEAPGEQERIGYVYLPPAGIRGRTPAEMVEAASTWTVLQAQSLHRGVCPRCSAPVDDSLEACETHDATDGLCDTCDRRFAFLSHSQCTNCPFELDGSAIGHLHSDSDVLAFLFEHGVDPFAADSPGTLEEATFEEELLGTDPLEARFAFTVEDDSLALVVDEDLTVVDVTRSSDTDSGR